VGGPLPNGLGRDEPVEQIGQAGEIGELAVAR
jgi:hypothetical protein